MKVLSLFDGISCGMVALERAGIPVEQRKFICKFLKQHQILTLYQAIHSYPELVCSAYKAKIRNWLEDCVESYEKEYSTPKESGCGAKMDVED